MKQSHLHDLEQLGEPQSPQVNMGSDRNTGKMWPFPKTLLKLFLLKKRLQRQSEQQKKCHLSNYQLGNRVLGRPDVHSEYIVPFPKIKFTLKGQLLSPLRMFKRTFSPWRGNLKVFPDQSHHCNKHTGSLRTGLREWCSCVCKEFCCVEKPNHWHTSFIFSADELLLCWGVGKLPLVYFWWALAFIISGC